MSRIQIIAILVVLILIIILGWFWLKKPAPQLSTINGEILEINLEQKTIKLKSNIEGKEKIFLVTTNEQTIWGRVPAPYELSPEESKPGAIVGMKPFTFTQLKKGDNVTIQSAQNLYASITRRLINQFLAKNVIVF